MMKITITAITIKTIIEEDIAGVDLMNNI
jgi:hypothetical protein